MSTKESHHIQQVDDIYCVVIVDVERIPGVVPQREKALTRCELGLSKMEDRGLEPVSVSAIDTSNLRQSRSSGGAESGAVGAESGLGDPRLALLNERWSDLPEAVKATIMNLVQQAAVRRER